MGGGNGGKRGKGHKEHVSRTLGQNQRVIGSRVAVGHGLGGREWWGDNLNNNKKKKKE